MYKNELDASIFTTKHKTLFSDEFENILSKIYECYLLMVNDNISLKDNENEIRDVLLCNYLNNNLVRERIGFINNFYFQDEAPENKNNLKGRADIKIVSKNTFMDTSAYYVIECKKLNNKNYSGIKGLNAKYIEHGINRFVINKYSCHYGVNGMLGFIVNEINIHYNINHINTLMTNEFQSNANVITILTKANFIDNYDYHYYSVHKDIDNKQFTLYHLMLDFASNISKFKN